MIWDGNYYVDTRLPFGSRSSPFIFNKFADILAWIICFVCGISSILHYLDDFLVGAKTKAQCKSFFDAILDLFSFLGVPIAIDKLEGPSTVLTYLGIEIDTSAQVIRLPEDKFIKLRTLLALWMHKHSMYKKGSVIFNRVVVLCC